MKKPDPVSVEARPGRDLYPTPMRKAAANPPKPIMPQPDSDPSSQKEKIS